MKTTATIWRVGAAALTLALSAWMLPGLALAAHGGGGGGGGGGGHGGGAHGGGGGFHSGVSHFSGGAGHGEFAHGDFGRGSGQGNWHGQTAWHGNGNWNGNGNWRGNGNWNGNGNWRGNGNWYWRNRGLYVYAPLWWYPFGIYGGYGDYGYGYASNAYDYPVPYQAGYSSGVAVANEEPPAPQLNNAGDQPVQAFASGDYREAARLAQHWAIDEPQNAKPHELLSLALFAMGEYRGAATEAHFALHLGPAADWPTLYGYYHDVDRYSQQAHALAKYVRENPKSPEGQFLLAYQNLMMGHKKAAADGFARVVALAPQDQIARTMLEQLGSSTPPATLPPPPASP